MDHSVRRAKPDDIPRLLELLLQVDMVHHSGRPDIFKGPATKYDKESLAAILSRDDAPVFVCTDANGYILGHAFCRHKQIIGDPVLTDIKTLYVDDICVDEAYRGQGVGKTLFLYVKKYAKEQRFYNLTLNVWSCNPQALRFYEKMGLKPQKIGMETIL